MGNASSTRANSGILDGRGTSSVSGGDFPDDEEIDALLDGDAEHDSFDPAEEIERDMWLAGAGEGEGKRSRSANEGRGEMLARIEANRQAALAKRRRPSVGSGAAVETSSASSSPAPGIGDEQGALQVFSDD